MSEKDSMVSALNEDAVLHVPGIAEVLEELSKMRESWLTELSKLRQEISETHPGSKRYPGMVKCYREMLDEVMEAVGLHVLRDIQITKAKTKLKELDSQLPPAHTPEGRGSRERIRVIG